jgi:hypothetical protein
MLCQVDGLADGSLNAIRLYPASVDSANSTQRDARTAVNTIQNTVTNFYSRLNIFADFTGQSTATNISF